MQSKIRTAILSAGGFAVVLLSFFVTLKVLEQFDGAPGNIPGNVVWTSTGFSEVGWAPREASLKVSASTAPDGRSATKLVENSAVGRHYLGGVAALPGRGTYVWSLFVKPAERQGVMLEMLELGTNGKYVMAQYDLAAAKVTARGGDLLDAGIQNISNGWIRVWVTSSLTSQNASLGISLINDKQEIAYPGTSDFGLHIWTAQIEKKS